MNPKMEALKQGRLTKVAAIRDPLAPAGRPAQMFLNCPCGADPKTSFKDDGPDVVCKCGTVYSPRGYVISPPRAGGKKRHTDSGRRARESAVWKSTHRDYRSMYQGKKHILVNSPSGTTLKALSDMSDDELRKYGPKGGKRRHSPAQPKATKPVRRSSSTALLRHKLRMHRLRAWL